MIAEVAVVCLIWYCFIVAVCCIGLFQLVRWYSSVPEPAISESLGDNAPHVTIVRPVKGLDVCLYECLESSFRQTYPKSRTTIYLCVAERDDPAVPILEEILTKFPDHDARLLVEAEDALLNSEYGKTMGPNPKIRTMSRGYREAKGDIIWIMDCNVWAAKGTCGRMVDELCGFGGRKPNKFVHQLPLVVDLHSEPTGEAEPLLSVQNSKQLPTLPSKSDKGGTTENVWAFGGGRLEEAWFSAAHAKFYTAINTVLIAPCIVGKSNMFRKSHLNALTDGLGIDYVSHNICEDHLIGDLLWKRPIPSEILDAARTEDGKPAPRRWGHHALDFGDMAIQPVKGMSVGEFISRRVRWLRVRKFTVVLATFVEPGTESVLCSLYGAFAVTTLPLFQNHFNIPATWSSFVLFWLLSMTFWAVFDRILYLRLQSGASIDMDAHTPDFARFKKPRDSRSWLLAWIGREFLALPIWTWAVYGGATVSWRGKKFQVGRNMRVKEVPSVKARRD